VSDTTESPAPEEPVEREYTTEQFRFVDETAPPEVSGWLSFMNSRSARRQDRKERARERLVVAGALVGVLVLVVGLVAWRPWSSAPPADTGDASLGGDRATVVLQVQEPGGAALFTGLLMHDRRAGGRGAAVAVPADLQLPVAGEGRLTVRTALDQAGPTLSREGMGELLGLDLAGSWVLDRSGFAGLVDRLGGLASGAAGTARLDGAAALAKAADPAAGQSLLAGFAAAFPPTFTAGRDLLTELGVLPSPGLPVERLAALMTGLGRDAAAQRLGLGALPLDPTSRALNSAAALPVVRDLLGGLPGQGREDATPRILVQLAPGAATTEADVRADIVNAGYEYVAGALPAGRSTAPSVTVRSSMPEAQALGESVAKTLGLPVSVVRVADDVPFVADVAVVLGPASG
jgi:hypothetical protein